MRINNPKTGEYIETPCTGCMHHEVRGVQMGENPDICDECGCPTTEKGWALWVATVPSDRVKRA